MKKLAGSLSSPQQPVTDTGYGCLFGEKNLGKHIEQRDGTHIWVNFIVLRHSSLGIMVRLRELIPFYGLIIIYSDILETA